MVENEILDVWITKYALTEGIQTARAERCKGNEDMIRAGGGYFHRSDWHCSEADALARVTQMLQGQRKSVAKKLAKLDKLEAALKAGTFKIKAMSK